MKIPQYWYYRHFNLRVSQHLRVRDGLKLEDFESATKHNKVVLIPRFAERIFLHDSRGLEFHNFFSSNKKHISLHSTVTERKTDPQG